MDRKAYFVSQRFHQVESGVRLAEAGHVFDAKKMGPQLL